MPSTKFKHQNTDNHAITTQKSPKTQQK